MGQNLRVSAVVGTSADGSLQFPPVRCRSSAAGSLPGRIVEEPSHVLSRREEVTELFVVTGGAECR